MAKNTPKQASKKAGRSVDCGICPLTQIHTRKNSLAEMFGKEKRFLVFATHLTHSQKRQRFKTGDGSLTPEFIFIRIEQSGR
jgi:hypothetical protein